MIASIPIPGVDREGLKAFIENNQLLGMLNLFSGSGLTNFSIVALGVYPYITASIIMQLMTPIIPRLNELSMEGQQGRNKINQYTHILTVPLALLQGYGQTLLFSRQTSVDGQPLIENFGLFDADTWLPTVAILLTLTAGTMFLVWIGELITEKGIGNGISVIIFGGIVASLPSSIGTLVTGGSFGTNVFGTLLFVILALITIVGVVLINEGQRRIPVHHAKRVRSGRVYGGTTTNIPLKVNSAGMIPLIFAVSIMVFPGMIASFLESSNTEWVQETGRANPDLVEPGHPALQRRLLLHGGGLHLLLHDGGVPATADPRIAPATGGVHPRRAARTQHGGLPAEGALADHDRRCALPRSHRHPSVLRDARSPASTRSSSAQPRC